MQVEKLFRFEASHILPRHPGKCSRLHGHSWRVKVSVFGPVNPATGFVMDFAELKKLVQPIIDRFDHQHLNAFVRYPSSENIALHIAYELLPHINMRDLRVEVSETENTWAVWDGREQYARALFADSDLSAEWRSPEFNKEFVELYDNQLVQQDQHIFADWSRVHTEVVQREMYRASLGRPGAVQEELKQVVNEEKQKSE